MRKQVGAVGGANLEKEAVEIVDLQETRDQAVADVLIRTAVRMEKGENGEWLLREIRLGDRQWERVDRIVAALQEVRRQETRERLQRIEEALRRYVEDRGERPQVSGFPELIDSLNPGYLEQVVRLDAWENPLRLDQKGPWRFVSAGPDGDFGTEDDIELTYAE